MQCIHSYSFIHPFSIYIILPYCFYFIPCTLILLYLFLLLLPAIDRPVPSVTLLEVPTIDDEVGSLKCISC